MIREWSPDSLGASKLSVNFMIMNISKYNENKLFDKMFTSTLYSLRYRVKYN